MEGKDSGNEKFAADKMLGRLTRWLRIIGQDVIYGSHLSGYGLIRKARIDGRVILTRDRSIRRLKPPAYILIQSDHFRDQLKQVIRDHNINPLKDLFTRCVECNTLLDFISKNSVENKVPSYVFSTQGKFSICRSCQRIYWPATHLLKMIDELKTLGFNYLGA